MAGSPGAIANTQAAPGRCERCEAHLRRHSQCAPDPLGRGSRPGTPTRKGWNRSASPPPRASSSTSYTPWSLTYASATPRDSRCPRSTHPRDRRPHPPSRDALIVCHQSRSGTAVVWPASADLGRHGVGRDVIGDVKRSISGLIATSAPPWAETYPRHVAEPSRYIHGHAESVLRSHRWRTADNSAGYLLAHLRPGIRILDVGCGPGTITLDLARLIAPTPVVGLDPVEAPLAAARADAAAAGVDNVTYQTGDVTALAFGDGSFDVVHAHQVLQHLTDPVAALREMGRVCRDDGVVAARDADYAAMTWFPADPRLDRWRDRYCEVARAGGGEPDAGRRLLAWARAAGFGHVEPSASAWCFATPDDRAWWGETWAERVRTSTFGHQALEGALATESELDDLAE